MKKSCTIILVLIVLLVLTSCSKAPQSKETNKAEPITKSIQQENTEDDSINNEKGNLNFYFGQYQVSEEGFSEYVNGNAIDRDYEIEFEKFNSSPEFTTQGWVELEDKYYRIWDKELNNIYNKLLKKLNVKEKEKLCNAQKGWLQFHVNESEFICESWDDLGLGSQGRVQLASSVKYRIRQRTLDLMKYYYMLGGEVEFLYKGEYNLRRRELL